MRSSVIIGLDVGTTKVSAIAAEFTRGGMRVLGAGTTPSRGMKKGMIVNIDAAVDSIVAAIKETEASSGVRIKSVLVGVSGTHIKSFDSAGAVGVRGGEVSRADVGRAVDSAKAVYMPLDREVLHVVPTEFILDGHEGITDPVGMCGVRLEAKVHIVTGAVSSLQNLFKCCDKAGLGVADVVCEPVAAAHCILTGEEKESGAILVDIGGGTTGIAFFKDNGLRHTSVLGIGGNHLTNDVSLGLRIPASEAERIKKESGAAFETLVPEGELITVAQPNGQGRSLPAKYVAEILQPRCEEIIEMIREEIKKSSAYDTAVCGIVLTGGSSLLKGIDRMTESFLGLPTRTGAPEGLRGLQGADRGPENATAAGLLTYAFESQARTFSGPEALEGVFGKIKERMKGLLHYKDYLNLISRKEGGMACLKSRK
jgi:cell division protein FtsA